MYHHTNRKFGATFLTVLAAALGLAAPAVAAPEQPSPALPGDDPAGAGTRVAALYRQAEVLTQAYDAAQEQADRLTIAVQQSQSALARGRAEYAAQRAALGTIAAAEYRGGTLDQQLRLLMQGEPETYLDNAAAVDQLSTEQLLRVAVVIEHQRELMQLQQVAADQLTRLSAARAAADDARRQVEDQLREAQGLLNTLPETQRRQIAADELGADPAFPGNQIPESAFTDILPQGRARLAIAAAFADLGKPYVFGAEGPDAFDCSGLMQRVWRQAGVDLPRTSSEQALAGRAVPLSAIEPGDMVIYYRGRSHIGLYIGGGKIIHAPHPGSEVRISPVDSMPVTMVVRV